MILLIAYSKAGTDSPGEWADCAAVRE